MIIKTFFINLEKDYDRLKSNKEIIINYSLVFEEKYYESTQKPS